MIRVAGRSSSRHQTEGSRPPEVELRLALSSEGAALLQSISGVGADSTEAGAWNAARVMAFVVLVLEQLRDMGVADAWIYGPVEDWCEQAGFASPAELNAAMNRLEDQGMVITRRHVLGNSQVIYVRAPDPLSGRRSKRGRCGPS